MPKIVTPLVDTQLKNAKPKDKEYNLADGQGLYLRVKPSGRKVWLFNYSRPYTGKRANLSIGRYPDISLTDARSESQKYRNWLSKDEDPSEKLKELALAEGEAQENTFEAVGEKWFKRRKAKKKLTESYAEDVINSLRNHVFPKIGEVPIHKITARMAIGALEPLEAEGKHETVKRLCQRLNMIMNYAINTGILPKGANPLVAIREEFTDPEPVHFPSLDWKELPGLLQKVDEAETSLTIRNLFYWQLSTMTRPSEAAGARWDEIDPNAELWVIPEKRMKRRREHKVPLTPQTLQILEAMKSIGESSEYIFPALSDRRKPINSEALNNLFKRLGLKGKQTAHGLRSIASTTLNENAWDSDLIEVCLAHVEANRSKKSYDHSEHLERRKKLMCWWSNHIEEASTGHATTNGKKHLKVV